jgi:hypothetical protein
LNYPIPWDLVEGKGNFVQDSGAIPIKIDLLFYLPSQHPPLVLNKSVTTEGCIYPFPRNETVLKDVC